MSLLKGVLIIGIGLPVGVFLTLVVLTFFVAGHPSAATGNRPVPTTVTVVHHANSRSATFLYVDGELRNNGGQPARFVQAVGTFYDAGGTFIGTNSAYVGEIAPGQTVAFKIMFRDPDNRAVTYRVRAET